MPVAHKILIAKGAWSDLVAALKEAGYVPSIEETIDHEWALLRAAAIIREWSEQPAEDDVDVAPAPAPEEAPEPVLAAPPVAEFQVVEPSSFSNEHALVIKAVSENLFSVVAATTNQRTALQLADTLIQAAKH